MEGFAELAGALVIDTDTRPLGRATDALARIDGHNPVDGTDQLPTALLTTKTTFEVVGPVVMPANNITASYAS